MQSTDRLAAQPGETLGAYRIEALLGEGAMGEVYRAVHQELRRPVAIKLLKPSVATNPSLLERFFAEARAVNLVRHENIVECTDLVRDNTGRSYIIMELLEGSTLASAIKKSGRIDPPRAIHIAAQIASAMHAAHQTGIVHRDLKPENIFLIHRAGSDDYVKILDFGIARLRPDLGALAATQSGLLIGTPAYMSPEQVRGEPVGPASDIYSLGVILFEMLSGRLPFEASTISMMLVAQIHDLPPHLEALVEGIPHPLSDAVNRALAKSVNDRFATMNDLRDTLFRAIESTASPSGSQAIHNISAPPSERPPTVDVYASTVAVNPQDVDVFAPTIERPATKNNSQRDQPSQKKWWAIAFPTFALLIILLSFGVMHLRNQQKLDLLTTARQLREDYRLEKWAAVSQKSNAILQQSQNNGHGLYFQGEALFHQHTLNNYPREAAAFRNSERAKMRSVFYRYLDQAERTTESNTGNAESCYERESGYCAERTGWVAHIMANDFYEEAQVQKDPAWKREAYLSSCTLVRTSLNHFSQGFSQMTPTRVLREHLIEQLTQLGLDQSTLKCSKAFDRTELSVQLILAPKY